mgnify:CR=1 FL=1
MEKAEKESGEEREKLISKRNSMEKTAEGKCTSCAGNKTAGTHKKTGNKITESGAAETGCGKHRDSGGRKGADRKRNKEQQVKEVAVRQENNGAEIRKPEHRKYRKYRNYRNYRKYPQKSRKTQESSKVIRPILSAGE